MKVAIVTTGDEIMAGDIADTNAQWISNQCWQRGASVVWKVCVGDDAKAIGDACKEAASKADAVLVTGGLGPTVDDITLPSAKKTLGWKKEKTIPNKVGTAEGLQVDLSRTTLFFFPGVPNELYPMFQDFFLPWLDGQLKGETYQERVLKCFGVPEKKLDSLLRGVDLHNVVLSFRVPFPEVWLKLRIKGKNKKEMKSALDRVAKQIYERAGDSIFGEGDDSLAKIVGDLLKQKKKSIAVAESCTGGYITNQLTNIPGSSEYLERSVISYSYESKEKLLDVPSKLIKENGAVSEPVAKAMALGIQKKAGTDYAISVTGIAGPSGATKQKPVGTVYIGLATPKGVSVQHFCFARSRLEFKELVCATALDWLRKKLL